MLSAFAQSITRPLICMLIACSLLLALAACSPDNQASASSSTPLPPGDATRGAELFNQSVNGAPPCTTCHTTDDTTLVGPGMKGFGGRAGSRVSGETAEEYAQQSILKPASFIVPGFTNAMYNGYASKLSPQDMADLIAYLLSS